MNVSILTVADLCRQAYSTAKSKGWWEIPRTFGDFCALFHTEISEAVEAYRKSGKVDAIFVTGNTEKFEQAGLHTLSLDRLPMINGPTLTSTLTTLQKKPGLAERLVKAQVMGIHYARTRRGETEKILEGLRQRVPQCKSVNYRSVAKLLPKPYPDHEAVANAYKLCCLKTPETEEMSPMALWDLHYLRELDNSGYIDELYRPN